MIPQLRIERPNLEALADEAPLLAIVFLGFLAVGLPLGALSLHLHDSLGLGTVLVGLTIGLQSAATVLTRDEAGSLSDRRGPRRAVLVGLPFAVLSGALYLAAQYVPVASFGLILAGRLAMGVGEALLCTGALSWGIGRLGPERTGLVMSWQGIAMFAAVCVGAAVGLAIQRQLGFTAVAISTMAGPALAFGGALALPGVPGHRSERVPLHKVLDLVWRPGTVLALGTAPFAALSAFVALDYQAQGWRGAAAAIAGFGAAYVAVRIFFSHLPDQKGGVAVATVSLGAEAVGQALMWLAPHPAIAFVGAVLTGAGFSLVFPSMGVEATRRADADLRGRAVGDFTAFFDLALGLTGPLVGIAAGAYGFPSAFLIGALSAIAGLVLLRSARPPSGAPPTDRP